jgi:DNA-binding IclR family transcriptional regulator
MPLPDPAADEIVRANATRLREHGGLTVPRLMNLLRRAREAGYAVNDVQLTPGAISIGQAICWRGGDPIAAVSIGAIADRMAPARQAELAAAMRSEVTELERLLSSRLPPR